MFHTSTYYGLQYELANDHLQGGLIGQMVEQLHASQYHGIQATVLQLSSVEFPITFSQFLLNLDCESICDPPGGDTLLAKGIYLTDSLN